MCKLTFVLALFGFNLSAWASKGVSVADLERVLAADRGKPDAQVAQQLSGFELTERLSAATLVRLESFSPGKETSQELRLLADQSAFLSLPVAEIPTLPLPDQVEQRQIASLVVTYVSKTIRQLPNFFATRVTTHFEESPQIKSAFQATPYRSLHETSASNATVFYQNGREVVEAAKKAAEAAKSEARGLRPWGVFGPVLSTVFLDAARSSLSWSHWEKLPSGTVAVFRYEVLQQNSHYRVTYCCIFGLEPESTPTRVFDRIVAYHGEFTVDPHDGSILRLTLEADLKASDPIQRADIMVEYGPVDIGGKTYICATKSVALSSALSPTSFHGDFETHGEVTQRPPQKLLNEVAFRSYHMYRADSRILTADVGEKSNLQSTDLPPASPPSPLETKAAEDHRATPETQDVAAATELKIEAPPTFNHNATADAATIAKTIDPATVFKVTTRQVVVDVVASKADGQPLLGLLKGDFEVNENGKPQTINFFEEPTPGTAVRSDPIVMPAMPAGARTNVPPAAPSDAVNVLLIDTLNAEVQDQAAVRRQVISFLTKVPSGPKFAIFVLGSQLRCLQGFTSDSSALLAALNDPRDGLKGQKSLVSASRSDQASDAEEIATLQTEQTSPIAIAALKEALGNASEHDNGARASMTFEALIYLGHYLSGIPGRKNLVWFASSFPVVILPSEDQLTHIRKNSNHPEYLDRVKSMADLYKAAQIAVYPINAEGMMMDHVGEALAAGPGEGGGVGHTGSQDVSSTTSPYKAEADARTGTINAMEQLAASTGGKAFYNTNDLSGALKRAIDDGAHYYTLGYSPADKNMDGSYRRIEIKSIHGKSKLAYRRGYIASDSVASSPKTKVDPLAPLLRFGLPGATGILYGVHAETAARQPSANEPRAGQNQNLSGPMIRYTVDFVVRSQDILLQPGSQGDWTGKVLIGLKAYDRDGNAVNWGADEETLTIKREQFDSLRNNGISAHVDIDLPKVEGIHLVTAVYDLTSAVAGTLEIPLQADK